MSSRLIVNVSSVLSRIKAILSQQLNLDHVWVQGEVSNLTKHRSGHYYFSLKDTQSEIHCVMFSSYVSHLDFILEEGMKVLVSGQVNLYEPRGSLQFYVKEMKLDGIGDLYQEFEQRKKRFEQEGFFDIKHKKEKPRCIAKIALITAREGAALHDVLSTVQKRWPMLLVDLYPAYVQGSNAPSSLIRQLKRADEGDYDAILIVRGGGSFEDLFCFNDENLIKTIYSAKTYIVSGVGHEVDTTLCDLVSDHRAVTPTAAAQWVTLDQGQMKEWIQNTRIKLSLRAKQIVSSHQQKLSILKKNPYLQDPLSWIATKRIHLDHTMSSIYSFRQTISTRQIFLSSLQAKCYQNLHHVLDNQSMILSQRQDRLYETLSHFCKEQRQKLLKLYALLDAYSPLKVLSRGYTITSNEENIVRSIEDIDYQHPIYIRFVDGILKAMPIEKE